MSKNRFSSFSAIKTLQSSATPKETKKTSQKATVKSETAIQGINDDEKRRRGRPNGKRSNDNFRQVTAYIEKDTHKQTKMRLLANDETQEFSELINDLLKKWLEENK
jgi:uncharacterized Rmd1/YagE family protein